MGREPYPARFLASPPLCSLPEATGRAGVFWLSCGSSLVLVCGAPSRRSLSRTRPGGPHGSRARLVPVRRRISLPSPFLKRKNTERSPGPISPSGQHHLVAHAVETDPLEWHSERTESGSLKSLQVTRRLTLPFVSLPRDALTGHQRTQRPVNSMGTLRARILCAGEPGP